MLALYDTERQRVQGTYLVYRRWRYRYRSSSAFMTLIMIRWKERFTRLPIPLPTSAFLWVYHFGFLRSDALHHYTIFFRQSTPVLQQFVPASCQLKLMIGRPGILSQHLFVSMDYLVYGILQPVYVKSL